jgi:hypothetical protein
MLSVRSLPRVLVHGEACVNLTLVAPSHQHARSGGHACGPCLTEGVERPNSDYAPDATRTWLEVSGYLSGPVPTLITLRHCCPIPFHGQCVLLLLSHAQQQVDAYMLTCGILSCMPQPSTPHHLQHTE